MKKYFIVSDIHSCYTELINVLNDKGFDIDNNEHILFVVGDLFDRGLEAVELLAFIEKLISLDRVIGVLGNHDLFLLDWVNHNLSKFLFNYEFNGFKETYNAFSNGIVELDDIKEHGTLFKNNHKEFINWLEQLPLYKEFTNHVFVHGALDFSLEDFRNTPRRFCIWEKQSRLEVSKDFNKTVVVGHEALYFKDVSNDIFYGDKYIMLDGGCVYGGQLNCLVLDEESI